MTARIGGKAAADRLGVSKQMLSQYVQRPDFPPHVMTGRMRTWLASDLDEWRAGHPKGGAKSGPHPDRGRRAFAAGLDRVHAYRAAEGHALVPRDAVTPSGFLLGSWVNDQRVAYRRGLLPPDRVAALEAVPDWTWEPPLGRAATVAREALRDR